MKTSNLPRVPHFSEGGTGGVGGGITAAAKDDGGGGITADTAVMVAEAKDAAVKPWQSFDIL